MYNKELFKDYIDVFKKESSKVNLISKHDENYIWEKHIFDSLSLGLFFEKYKTPNTLLDIGTGGGFPSIPIAIMYPDIKIYAVDSIAKKIRAVENIKTGLNLENLIPICSRIENLNLNFECITSRAVASLDKICEYALPKLSNGGYFIAYKSKNVNNEIKLATKVLQKFNSEIIDLIEYQLPVEEQISRNLVIIKKIT